MSAKPSGNFEMSLFNDILDAFDCQVIIVREEDCNILYMNASAKNFLNEKSLDSTSCRAGYGNLLADACKKCINKKTNFSDAASEADSLSSSFTTSAITWHDNKPAVLILYRPDLNSTADKRLYRLAYLDTLTGIPNRLKLQEDFRNAIEMANKINVCGALALIDLDHFKAINEAYGHNVGDIMLKRFADYIQADPNYSGHFYRLGGDEFVLFYFREQTDLNTLEQLHQFYEKLFADIFYSYTMPGISLSCTISMGVSIFPESGTAFSELLRKADIALYKAKSHGRNKMVFFENKYEEARKFNEYYVTIRPILSDHGKTYGYELVDSDSSHKILDHTLSLNLSEFNRALDALSLHDLESDAYYFIEYSHPLSSKVVIKNLPKNQFIIQVKLPKNYTQKHLKPYKALRSQGYRLALDGFDNLQLSRDLLLLFDYFILKPGTLNIFQKKIMDATSGKIFIASNVDTIEEFENSKRLGFKLFQGRFFNQPIVAKKEKSIDPLHMNYLRLIQLTSIDSYLDFEKISKIISEDLAFSYKLLRLLNSAAFGLRSQITSISMAVSYLGEVKLKKWIALLALRGVASKKPLELVRMSLIRARFGELLSPYISQSFDPNQVFMFGLISLLHIMLDKSQEDLFREIQVSDEIQRSLLTAHGAYSPLLGFFEHYECANWEYVATFAEKNKLSNEWIYDSYVESINWYNSLIRRDSV